MPRTTPHESPSPEGRPPYPSLIIGMQFDSLKDGANAVTDAIVEAHESFKVLNGNGTFWAAQCRQKTAEKCGFKVRDTQLINI